MKRLSLFLLMLMLPLGFAKGQTQVSPFVPIWGNDVQEDYIVPYTLAWSDDSKLLYFRADNSFTRQIKQYDVTTNKLIDVPSTRQAIQLSIDQQKHFHARDSVGYAAPNQDTFAYISTYQGYALGEGGYTPYLYGIGSLEDQNFLPTRVSVYELGRFRWSDDSSTLVIEQSTPYGGQEAISYIKSTTSSCSGSFCAFAETYLTSLDTGETIYDLSPDGDRILYPGFNGALYLWDVTKDAGFGEVQDAGTDLPLEGVIGAAFLPNNPDKILAITQVGLIRYDLTRRQSVVIDSQVNSKWANWAMFSPDNQWVAVLAGGGYGRKQLFVLSAAG